MNKNTRRSRPVLHSTSPSSAPPPTRSEPEPKFVPLTVSVEPGQRAAIEDLARRDDRSLSFTARRLLQNALAGYSATPPPVG